MALISQPAGRAISEHFPMKMQTTGNLSSGKNVGAENEVFKGRNVEVRNMMSMLADKEN